MSDTRVLDPSSPSPRRAAVYEMRDAGPRDGEWRGEDAPGAWGVRSSLRDLARYNGALAADAAALRPVRGEMESASRLTGGEEATYAAGLFVGRYRGQPVVRHAGRTMIDFVRFPRSGRAVAVLCNRDDVDAETLSEKAADLFVGDVLAPRPPAALLKDYPSLPGHYLSANGEHMAIEAEDGTLALSGWRALGVVGPGLLTTAPSTDDMRLRIEEEEPSGPRLVVAFQSSRPTSFAKFSPVRPTRAELEQVSGRYVNDAFGVGYTISADGEGARLVLPDGGSRPLTPLTPDRFEALGWRVAIERDARGRVAGLTVATSRTGPLRFRKAEG